MPLTKHLIAVGNSAGLTFDKPILKQVGWELGTEVELRIQGESIVLSPYRKLSRAALDKTVRAVATKHRKSLDKLGR